MGSSRAAIRRSCPFAVIAHLAARCGCAVCEATSRLSGLRLLSSARPSGVLIMTRFWFFVPVERHRVVVPTSSRLWAAAVPAL